MKVAVFTLGILMLATSVSATPCQIARSVYRDADRKGFELVFDAPIMTTGTSAIATINHVRQGRLYSFNVTQASGYGSIFLWNDLERGDSLRLNFFGQNLTSATPIVLGEELKPPDYAFIAGLGSYDYYRRRSYVTENSPPLLGDVMWIYDRCQ
jgi:hypothetical protein